MGGIMKRISFVRASGRSVVVLALLAPSLIGIASPARAAATIRVPEDYATISAAINGAANGDTIDIAPGVYTGAIVLNKSVTLRGRFGDPDDPRNNTTILDAGSSTLDVITIPAGISPGPTVTGLVLRNGVSGVSTRSSATIEGNSFVANNDQLDYKSGGGGVCRNNVMQDAMDDGIDINHPVRDMTIEGNVIVSSDGDGVEMRLNDDTIAATAHIVFRGNEIWGSRSDGIQIIDYYALTNRIISIERNLIHDNGRAGIGLLDNGTTIEDYRAASILERITVFHNTLVRNNHGISGGDNLIALNNILVGHFLGLKNVDGGSIASHNLFWGNTTDASGSIVEASITADPKLDPSYGLQTGSPAIDAGVARFEWKGEVVMDQPTGSYQGSAPDLGWKESVSEPGGGSPPVMGSVGITPSSPGTNAVLTANPTATDPEGDAVTFSYQWAKNGTNLAGARSKTLDLSVAGNGDKGDLISVTVTASDGVSTSSPMTSAAVTVVNTNPTFDQNLGNRSNAEGDVVALSAGASDPDGDALIYAATGLPPGLGTDGGTGSISGTIASGAAGSSPYSVSITVRDGATVDATDTFTWTVTAEPTTTAIVFHGAAGAAISARSRIAIARPVGVVAGDVEVASILVVGAATVTAPAGWSLVRSDANGTLFRQLVYVHVAGSAEPSTYRWKLSQTSKGAGTLSAYAGVDTTNPIAASSGLANASSTSITATGVSDPVAGGLLLGSFGILTDLLNAIAPPGGMTERIEVTPASGKPKPALELAEAPLASSGATGDRTATASLAGPNIGQLVILRPAAP
jgi:hypothetical protein